MDKVVSTSKAQIDFTTLRLPMFPSLFGPEQLRKLRNGNVPVKNVEEVAKIKRNYAAGRPLCLEDRQKIVCLFEKGIRVSHIAKIIGVTHSCVSKIMSRYRRTGSVHPKITSKSDVKSLDKTEKKKVLQEKNQLPFSIERILSLEPAPPAQSSLGPPPS